MKSARDDKLEYEKLEKANEMVKQILENVNGRVAEKQKEDRHLDIFKRIDAKSTTTYKKDKFRKSDIIGSNRKLKFEGVASLILNGRVKMQMQNVIVVVLTDCLFFLQETSQKYQFCSPDPKAGVVSLQNLLIRDKPGTDSHRTIYIIYSGSENPQIYELKVQQPKDKNVWIESIR